VSIPAQGTKLQNFIQLFMLEDTIITNKSMFKNILLLWVKFIFQPYI